MSKSAVAPGHVYMQGPVFGVVKAQRGYNLTARAWKGAAVSDAVNPGSYEVFILSGHDHLWCARKRCRVLNAAYLTS